MKNETDISIGIEDLKRALAACAREARDLNAALGKVTMKLQGYRQLLMAEGLSPNEIETLMSATGQSARQPGPTAKSSRRFKGKTIAEAAILAIREAPDGKLHAKFIMQRLADGGLTIGGGAPKSTLFSTLSRNKLVERVPGEPNTWRVAAGGQQP